MPALIFDMDGVLVNSQPYFKTVGAEFLRRLVPVWDDSLQRSILGMSAYDVYQLLVSRHGLKISREDFVNFYGGLAAEIYGNRCEVFPGAISLMRSAQLAGWKAAVATSSPRAWLELVIERFELRPLLSAAVSSEEVAAKTKPAPDIYLHTASQVGLAPSECVAIEDTTKGIQSARGAAMKCIGFRNGYNDREDFSLANLEIADFNELSVERVAGLLRQIGAKFD